MAVVGAAEAANGLLRNPGMLLCITGFADVERFATPRLRRP
jgi:hypothetical protein